MAVTIICRIKNNPMNSLSPNDDGRRTSPRKSACRMPHYLSRESNKEKVGKGVKKPGRGVNEWAVAEESEMSLSSDSVRSIQPRKKSRGTTVKEKGGKGVKKLGGGVNKCAVAEESELSSSSGSVSSIQPRKKSRGTTVGQMSGGTRTVRVSREVKVAKEKKSKMGASALKGKKTQEYRSDYFSSSSDDSSDDSTQKATKGNHSIKDLLEKIEEKDKVIRLLNLKLSHAKVTSRMNKTKV